MSLQSKGEIQDQDGNTWHVMLIRPHYEEECGMRTGKCKVYFRRNMEDVLSKHGIFHEGELEDMLAGKGRIRVNTGRAEA